MRGLVIQMSDLAGSESSEAATRLGTFWHGFAHAALDRYRMEQFCLEPTSFQVLRVETLDDVSSWKELL